MLRGRTLGAAAAVVALCMGVLGCGDSEPEPSIPREDAEALITRLDEIQANIDEGSCIVAADRTDDLLAEIDELPDDVNQDVENALGEGANNLKQLLLEEPEECEPPVETQTEETTTEEETETEETQTRETTTQPTQTQETTPTQPTTPGPPPPSGGGSGGVGPGGVGGGP